MSINNTVTTYASRLRGFDREKQYRPIIPRNSFTFFMEFGFNEDVVNNLNYDSGQFENLKASFEKLKDRNSIYVKAFTKPAYEFDTEKLYAYNTPYNLKKRLNYTDVTLTFYDDTNSVVRNFLEFYRIYNVNTVSGKSVGNNSVDNISGYNATKNYNLAKKYPPNSPNFDNFQSIGLRTHSASSSNVLDYIILYDLGTNRDYVQVYTLFNPIIKSVDTTQLDYADGEGSQEVTVTLEYTYYSYNGNVNAQELHNGEDFFIRHLDQKDFRESNNLVGEKGSRGFFDRFLPEGVQEFLSNTGIDPSDLVQAVQASIQGGELNFSDLRRNLFETVASGTPIQNIRNVVTNIRLIEQAFEQGRFTDILPLLGEGLQQLELGGIDLRNLRDLDGVSFSEIIEAARDTISEEVSDTLTWLDLHPNPKRIG